SAEMLRKEGLADITRNDFYNINRKNDQQGGKLTKQQEMQMIMTYMEDQGFHIQVRYSWTLDENGNKTGQRVLKDLFFINEDQIALGRRFVSDWMYETDATFNTNELRLPLSTMVGITNTGRTFPMVYCYIT